MAEKTTPTDLDAKLAQLTDAVAKLTDFTLAQAAQARASGDTSTVEQLTEVMASGIAEANMRSRQWWDETKDPGYSVLNPLGEKDHPRPELRRDIWWVGYHLQKSELLREEILLLNQIVPGEYDLRDDMGRLVRAKFFKVVARDPQLPDGPLQVSFPCASEDDRNLLARFDRGRGMVDLLLQIVPKPVQPPVPVAVG